MFNTYSYKKLKYALIMGLLLVVGFTGCNDDDENASGEIRLLSYGPSPALRGGQLKFIGTNLDQVSSIVFPNNVIVEEFVTKERGLLVIVVPQEAEAGDIKLTTSKGEIAPKSRFEISEPIEITSMPEKAKPGDTITLEGNYLNLVTGISFPENQNVGDSSFISHSATSIRVKIPLSAQTGRITLYAGDEEEPLEVESKKDLILAVPTLTGLTPNPVKPGGALTISGTDLDLITSVMFPGNILVNKESFSSQSTSKIELIVPANVDEGKPTLQLASSVSVESSLHLETVTPAISSLSPNPAKNGTDLTISGSNLDLVTSVTFGGGANADPSSASATEIVVTIPANATAGTITLNTESSKTVISAGTLDLVKPAITTFSPATVYSVNDPVVTITGSNLDLVTEIIFKGAGKWGVDSIYTASPSTSSETSLTVEIPKGAMTGKFHLKTDNGTLVETLPPLKVVPDAPEVTGVPEEAFVGSTITLNGINMSIPADFVLPGGKYVTRFGSKTSTSIEIVVPDGVTLGPGSITIVTYQDEVVQTGTIDFKIAGAEPVAENALIINDFDEEGHNLDWDNWGGTLELLSENPGPGIANNGNFIHGVTTVSSWSWIWGCNHAELAKPSVAKADYVFKVDVYITKAPPADANFEMEFSGTRVSLGNLGAAATPAWVTMTWDLSEFDALPDNIDSGGEWGLNINPTSPVDLTGIYMDNFRFEPKE